MGAFGTALALFHRARGGQGQQVEAALAYTGTLLQSPFMLDYAGKVWDEPRGRAALGSSPAQRLYQAADGWLFVGATSVEQLQQVMGEEAFEQRPVAHWVEQLTAAGIGAHRLVPITELMRDPYVVAHGLSVTREHDTGERITTTGPAPRLSRTPTRPGRPASSPGADAAEVLDELGRTDDLDALQRQGALLVSAQPLPAS
jgi:crotonobetainyl-CoA:carnitine CoA-transferase CaiB-like acyl-CoA transferase